MTRREIADLFARREKAQNERDFAAVELIFAEDCTVDSPTTGGTVVGRAAVDDIHRAWVGGFPDVRWTTDDLLIDGGEVAWVATVGGTDTGGFMGLPATGRPFDLPMVLLSTVRDGFIVRERRIYDFTGMLVQIGVLKARPAGPLPENAPASPAAVDPSEADRPPSRDAVVALLRARHDGWRRRDSAAIARLYAPTAIFDSHIAGRAVGSAAIAAVYERWWGAFADGEYVVEATIVDGAKAAEVTAHSGTDTGGFGGQPPTGKPFRLPVVWLHTFERGAIVYSRPIYDFTGMLVQIGVLKAKPA
jgi:steroid delta-isomerase-like uncharacterized protein